QEMSGANASPTGRSHQEMSGAHERSECEPGRAKPSRNASPTGRSHQEIIPTTDANLVYRVINGDRNAYGDLVLRHQHVLYRYMRGMGIDHDTALDILQDAFVKAYTHIKECRDPAHFRSWLFSIARNLCLDHLKNVRRLTVPFSMFPSAERIPSTEAEQNELKRKLREALDALPSDQRDAFLLKHDAGYTYDEVAEIASTTASAIKMRVHRARETLRAFLTGRDVKPATVTIDSASVVLASEKQLKEEI
ncbi:MAG: RNA polymerase sigma factor, partial [Acidobacteria bacterium]|nr:RNA polymerase sigma factor [Acidobacteriota bacterium]